MKSNKVKRAWILYWNKDNFGSQLDIAEDGEIAAILPANYSAERIQFLLQRLFAERMHTASELLANRSKRLEEAFNPRRIHGVENTGVEYIMGYHSNTNPRLVAKVVENVAEIDENTISWEEIIPPHQPWMCEFAGVVDCPDEKRSPIITSKEGFKR